MYAAAARGSVKLAGIQVCCAQGEVTDGERDDEGGHDKRNAEASWPALTQRQQGKAGKHGGSSKDVLPGPQYQVSAGLCFNASTRPRRWHR